MSDNTSWNPQIGNRIVSGVRSFADDMREQGIHVGLGSPPVCVTCSQAWPCDGEADDE